MSGGLTPEARAHVCVSVHTHKNMYVSTHTGTHALGGYGCIWKVCPREPIGTHCVYGFMQWCAGKCLIICSLFKERSLVYIICPFLWGKHSVCSCFPGSTTWHLGQSCRECRVGSREPVGGSPSTGVDGRWRQPMVKFL